MSPDNDSRARRLILLAALAVCALTFAALAVKARMDAQERGAGVNAARPPAVTATVPVSAPPTPPLWEPAPTPEPEREYVVRAHQGYMAVFRPGENVPLEITDTRVSSLRRADQLLLREGIPVRGAEALAMLLEDFSN